MVHCIVLVEGSHVPLAPTDIRGEQRMVPSRVRTGQCQDKPCSGESPEVISPDHISETVHGSGTPGGSKVRRLHPWLQTLLCGM